MKGYQIHNENKVPSPAILFYPERIEENIRRMIRMAGDAGRLRPHVKTYKLTQVVKMQMDAGIRCFKCATLSEAEMLGKTGTEDVLVAFPLYGPALDDFIRLTRIYPETVFSILIDNAGHARLVNQTASKYQIKIKVYLDLDVGMNRTGTPPENAFPVVQYLAESKWIRFTGLHMYDGHLHHPDLNERISGVESYFNEVDSLVSDLKENDIAVNELICGGTPTFPVHAQYQDRILSPGTVLLWDYRYSSLFEEMNFQYAAVILTRVISKTGDARLTLDLGHKAIASEMTPPRIHLPEIGDYITTTHSEEHLVIETSRANDYEVGDCLYGIPYHICPTVGLYDFGWEVRQKRVVRQWPITARTRALSFHQPGICRT